MSGRTDRTVRLAIQRAQRINAKPVVIVVATEEDKERALTLLEQRCDFTKTDICVATIADMGIGCAPGFDHFHDYSALEEFAKRAEDLAASMGACGVFPWGVAEEARILRIEAGGGE